MPAVNGPKLAAVPRFSASVAGTVPPTVSPVPTEQVTDVDFDGSLSEVACRLTEPEADALAALST